MADNNENVKIGVELDLTQAQSQLDDIANKLKQSADVKFKEIDNLENQLRDSLKSTKDLSTAMGITANEINNATRESRELNETINNSKSATDNLNKELNKTETEVKDINRLFTEAEDKVRLIAATQGRQTEEYRKAVDEAGKLKATLDQTNTDIDNIAVKTKDGFGFVNVTNSISLVVSSLTAVQAGMNLIGIENEDLIKGMAKLQYLMVFGQTIKDFRTLIQQSTLFNTILSQLSVNMNSNNILMKTFTTNTTGAITATNGLALAVKALGGAAIIGGLIYLIDLFTKLKKEAEKANEEIRSLPTIINNMNSENQRAETALANQHELELERAKAANKTETEIFKIQERQLNEKIKLSNKSFSAAMATEQQLIQKQQENIKYGRKLSDKQKEDEKEAIKLANDEVKRQESLTDQNIHRINIIRIQRTKASKEYLDAIEEEKKRLEEQKKYYQDLEKSALSYSKTIENMYSSIEEKMDVYTASVKETRFDEQIYTLKKDFHDLEITYRDFLNDISELEELSIKNPELFKTFNIDLVALNRDKQIILDQMENMISVQDRIYKEVIHNAKLFANEANSTFRSPFENTIYEINRNFTQIKKEINAGIIEAQDLIKYNTIKGNGIMVQVSEKEEQLVEYRAKLETNLTKEKRAEVEKRIAILELEQENLNKNYALLGEDNNISEQRIKELNQQKATILKLQDDTKDYYTNLYNTRKDYVDKSIVLESTLADHELDIAKKRKAWNDLYGGPSIRQQKQDLELHHKLRIAEIEAQYNAEMAAAANDATRQEQIAEEKKIAITKAETDTLNAKREINTQQIQLGFDLVNATGAALGQLADAIGENAKGYKALKISEAVISTISGATGSFMQAASTYPAPFGVILGAITAAGVLAAGYANVKKISQVPIEGEAGTGNVPTPSIDFSAPMVMNEQATQNVRITEDVNDVSTVTITDKELRNNENRRRFNDSLRGL